MSISRFDTDALCRILFHDNEQDNTHDNDHDDHDKHGLHMNFALAYSGGRDSHVLLHALCAVRTEFAARQKFNVHLTALHFDHGIASQSAEWAQHCEAVCRCWRVDFISERQPIAAAAGESLEARARESRYRWFQQVVVRGQILLTAHHADDQAETVLLNLLRGSGVHSLAGIPRQRILSAAKSTHVARPLLSFVGESIAEYAARHQLAWLEDPSNRAPQFDRNYLRASVMPLLKQRWRGAIRSIGNTAENCRQAAALVDDAMDSLLLRCQAPGRRGVFCVAPPLHVSVLKSLDQFQVSTLIRHWIHRHGIRSPSSGQLATLFQQVFVTHNTAATKSASIRWEQSELTYFNGYLYLIRRLDAGVGEWDVDKHGIGEQGAAVAWDFNDRDFGNGIRLEISHGGDLDRRRLHGKSVHWAMRIGGERMTLPGRQHTSALKKLFQQNAVPPWERRMLPLLKVDGEIAWAHGIGASAMCCNQNDNQNDNQNTNTSITLRFVVSDSA